MKREALRQQALMAALWARGDEGPLPPNLLLGADRIQRGIQAYQANAGASAERALASTFPTVQALVGENSFAALARALWHAQPPVHGDLARFGDTLPAFIADSEQLADVPYLADVARLDWHVATAERAADASTEAGTLSLLAEADSSQLQLELMPGTAVLPSAHPVVSVWLAHRPGEAAATHRALAREAIALGRGETAMVWRSGWRALVQAIGDSEARWVQGLLRGDTLAVALADAGEGFAFEPWLLQALQNGWLVRARQVA
jgi:hypothetical protein